jgi:RHS repeat-associated protein
VKIPAFTLLFFWLCTLFGFSLPNLPVSSATLKGPTSGAGLKPAFDGQESISPLDAPTPHQESGLQASNFDGFRPADDSNYYQYKDALGSTALVLDEGGNFVSRAKYDAFGSEESTYSVPGFEENTRRFTGKEMDVESGLQYFGARYYDPFVGRWTGKDPKKGKTVEPQSLNRYIYVHNNPLINIDPDGRDVKNNTKGTDVFVKPGADGIIYQVKPGAEYKGKNDGVIVGDTILKTTVDQADITVNDSDSGADPDRGPISFTTDVVVTAGRFLGNIFSKNKKEYPGTYQGERAKKFLKDHPEWDPKKNNVKVIDAPDNKKPKEDKASEGKKNEKPKS